jgi:hypothetical protein
MRARAPIASTIALGAVALAGCVSPMRSPSPGPGPCLTTVLVSDDEDVVCRDDGVTRSTRSIPGPVAPVRPPGHLERASRGWSLSAGSGTVMYPRRPCAGAWATCERKLQHHHSKEATR